MNENKSIYTIQYIRSFIQPNYLKQGDIQV